MKEKKIIALIALAVFALSACSGAQTFAETANAPAATTAEPAAETAAVATTTAQTAA